MGKTKPDTTGGRWLRPALVGIAVATVASGGLQMVCPGVVLKQINGPQSATDRHLFATIGMFMVAIGGLSLHGFLRHEDDPTVLLWAGLQKLGAAGAVAVGVNRRVFGRRALLVAGFDVASALGCLAYRRRLRGS